MDFEEFLEKCRTNKLASAVAVLGVLNIIYSLVESNWLGVLISIAVIVLILPEILNEE